MEYWFVLLTWLIINKSHVEFKKPDERIGPDPHGIVDVKIDEHVVEITERLVKREQHHL